MAMALHVPANDGPVEGVESGKQRRRRMPHVVMRRRRAAPRRSSRAVLFVYNRVLVSGSSHRR